jgi:hypothetical protein
MKHMIKTTSYEISKKLEEAGFSRQPFWIWTSEQCCAPYQTNHDGFRSYDLETILDALPKQFQVTWFGELGKSQAILRLTFEKDKIFYNHDSDELRNAMYWREKEVQKTENESLADMAGKMWLMLKERGSI